MPDIVNLDNMADLVKAYRDARDTADKWAQAAKALEQRIRDVMGEHTEGHLNGRRMFTYRHTGQFAAKRFTADHPDLAVKYTRPVTEQRLDTDLLKAEQPDLYTAYRARRFEVKG